MRIEIKLRDGNNDVDIKLISTSLSPSRNFNSHFPVGKPQY